MKFRPVCTAVISIGTALLLLSGIRCAQAAEIKIVSPGAYKDIEGPDHSGIWPEAARAQGITHRSEFDALPVGGAWLTEIRFRPDGAVPVGEVASFGRVQFSLSVTQGRPARHLIYVCRQHHWYTR